MIGILPFLIQWISLSQFGGRNNNEHYYYPGAEYTPKNHWTLLNEFQHLPEEEIEHFLPQICNMIVDRETSTGTTSRHTAMDPDLFEYFESILERKCAGCLTFGTRLCGVLKASQHTPSEGLFKNVLQSNQANILAQRREERMRIFQEKVEHSSSYGHNLSPSLSAERSTYFRDYMFLLDNLARLGIELKTFPESRRSAHLKHALSQCNALIYYRMLSKGRSMSSLHTSMHELYAYNELNPVGIASMCPAIAQYSLHLPLLHCPDRVQRVLRFVETECEILPSKDRCPYLVTVEVLAQEHTCRSELLYSCSSSPPHSREQALSYGGGGRSLLFSSDGSYAGDYSELREAVTSSNSDHHGMRSSNKEARVGTIDAPIVSTDRVIKDMHITSPSSHIKESDETLYQSSNANVQLFSRPAVMHPGRDHHTSPHNASSSRQHTSWSPLEELRGGSQSHNSSPISNRQPDQFSHNSQYKDNTQHRDSSQYDPFSNHNRQSHHQWNDRPTDQYSTNHPHPSGTAPPSPVPASNFPHADYYAASGRQAPAQQGSIIATPPPDFHLPATRSTFIRGRSWLEKKEAVRRQSPFGHLHGWDLKSFIVKSGDDLRKEVLAMQLIKFIKQVFELEGLDIYLKPYQIVSTGLQAGLVEFLENTQSVDRIKKALPKGANSLKDFFELSFGHSYSFVYAKALQNFVRSLAGYSLVTYVVQVKDRHNANILLDADGHVIHIDYGFILGDSPGFNINFESAPFKFPREYLDLMGGVDSAAFKSFEDLFLRGFLALQKHIDGLSSIIQLFYGEKRKNAADGIRSRLLFPQSHSDIISLIGDSCDNWRTKQYDWYQEKTNNIQT